MQVTSLLALQLALSLAVLAGCSSATNGDLPSTGFGGSSGGGESTAGSSSIGGSLASGGSISAGGSTVSAGATSFGGSEAFGGNNAGGGGSYGGTSGAGGSFGGAAGEKGGSGGTSPGGSSAGGNGAAGAIGKGGAGGAAACTPHQSPGPGGMNSGRDCLGCHGFAIGGNVYSNASGTQNLSGATIRLVDSVGAAFTVVSGQDGTFHIENGTIAWPATVTVSSCPSIAVMPTPAPNGSCNQCHDGKTNPRIHLP